MEGAVENGSPGVVATPYKNRNRGYQQLRVWQDAVEFYREICRVFRPWPHDLKRVVSHQIASADSIHRNLAEGYCRRSIHEYIQHLYIALGSLGESVSSLMAYRHAGQLSPDEFEPCNRLAFKLENELLRLIASLEVKRERGEWIDHLATGNCATGFPRRSHPPPLHHPTPSASSEANP